MDIWLNPKYLCNGCLASTLRIGEGSTIIPLRGSRPQANGGRKIWLLYILKLDKYN
nr:MAG TPA: hypothetical protein [Caudoviricetes sp.]